MVKSPPISNLLLLSVPASTKLEFMLKVHIVCSMSQNFRRQCMYSTHSKRKLKKQPNATSKLVGSVTKRHRKHSKHRDDIGKTNITQGSDNVFEDVGFEPKEAANLKIRADLLIDLREYIRSRGWTQAQAAAFFGETQPRISNLLKGEISRFSIDKLISMLARAGIRVCLQTKQRAA